MALAVAEKAFKDDPNSFRTRDLAYIADRKAKIAEALASAHADSTATARANEGIQAVQNEMAKEAIGPKEVIGTAEAHAMLAALAVVRKGVHGLVLLLSDSVLFEPRTWTLLPAAQGRLTRVAAALLEIKGQKLRVECFTDIWRPSRRDQRLSQQRADAVRSFLVSRGYPEALIQSRGIDELPGAESDAGTVEYAAGPRLEIIIEYAAR